MNPVIIKDRTYNEAVKRYAYPVGDYLCAVSFPDGYKIYKTKQGKPFIGIMFKTLEDCLGAIKVMYEKYGEYFPIWDNKEYEDADVPSLCRWSIKNGINLYEHIKRIEDDGVTIRCASLYQVA
jgi:hypothetical protein